MTPLNLQINRRNFIKQSTLGLGGVLVGVNLSAVEQAKPSRVDPFESVPLGKSKLKVSRVCMGTGVRGGGRQSNHTRMGKEKFTALVQGVYERGVRLFDTADLYGTHPFLIPALKDIPRSQYGIVTKIWFRPGGIPEAERPEVDVVVNRFLKELGTDYLDLVLLHCVESGKWPEELNTQMNTLAKLKEKGAIRSAVTLAPCFSKVGVRLCGRPNVFQRFVSRGCLRDS
jgi:hypothetical protein